MESAALRAHLERWMIRFSDAADLARETLKKFYGEKGEVIRYAESFEQSDYSRQLPTDGFACLFYLERNEK